MVLPDATSCPIPVAGTGPRAARLRLPVRSKPHDFTTIAPGVALGCRRCQGRGARLFVSLMATAGTGPSALALPTTIKRMVAIAFSPGGRPPTRPASWRGAAISVAAARPRWLMLSTPIRLTARSGCTVRSQRLLAPASVRLPGRARSAAGRQGRTAPLGQEYHAMALGKPTNTWIARRLLSGGLILRA